MYKKEKISVQVAWNRCCMHAKTHWLLHMIFCYKLLLIVDNAENKKPQFLISGIIAFSVITLKYLKSLL